MSLPALLAVSMLLEGTAPAASPAWDFSQETSGLDGRSKAVASIQSSTQIPNSIGVMERATLVLRCEGGRLEAFIAWPRLVAIRSARGGYRFDDLPPIMNEGFSTSTSGDGTFFYQRTIENVAASIVTSKRLVVRAESSDFPAQEATWDLTNNQEAAKRVYQGCR